MINQTQVLLMRTNTNKSVNDIQITYCVICCSPWTQIHSKN